MTPPPLKISTDPISSSPSESNLRTGSDSSPASPTTTMYFDSAFASTFSASELNFSSLRSSKSPRRGSISTRSHSNSPADVSFVGFPLSCGGSHSTAATATASSTGGSKFPTVWQDTTMNAAVVLIASNLQKP
ncbi:hypothetical protein K435DRAFT_963529 [Dendrothele bispora CBS 962.96]|uniref:Uncharacterized protein n=1 Tax=Dendrothele bispora (strain CBS 962.96) TaxID=1314807 RepID=A0A4S8MGS2_DENBC|nr:hypothetical protein K435DRAFT_963529 [Dendrothele bispora CBS 962.96]